MSRIKRSPDGVIPEGYVVMSVKRIDDPAAPASEEATQLTDGRITVCGMDGLAPVRPEPLALAMGYYDAT